MKSISGNAMERLNSLHRERGRLKSSGQWRAAISVQLAIITEVGKTDRIRDLANAWNYLSSLQHQVRDYGDAEQSAKKALEVYSHEPLQDAEVLACYQFMLATILAAQRRFAEAVLVADAGVLNYAVFHDPPDDFLLARKEDAALMRRFMERESDAAG